MYAHELSPSEREDVLYLYGTPSFDGALTMDKIKWDHEQGFSIDEDDADGSYAEYVTHTLQFDHAQATKLYPSDLFSPIVYELLEEGVATADHESQDDAHNRVDELYKFAANNPYIFSRIAHPTGVPTNIQLFDFAAPDVRAANINNLNMTFVFDKICYFLGIQVPNADETTPIDHLNGIDVFLIPNNQQTEKLGVFTSVDGKQVGGYAFVQANGRYALAIKDGKANKYITAHEFGHVLDFIATGKDVVTEDIPSAILDKAGITKKDITRYGATKDSELYAEAFSIASLGIRVREVTYDNGATHVQITSVSRVEQLLTSIFGEPKKDITTKAIHTKYHNLFRMMLKGPMPNASAAIQKNKKRLAARKS
jgi:hypothetical protein